MNIGKTLFLQLQNERPYSGNFCFKYRTQVLPIHETQICPEDRKDDRLTKLLTSE